MSDFTKEELEFIHKWLDWITKENYPLKNKIQSMIDNYCDCKVPDAVHGMHPYQGNQLKNSDWKLLDQIEDILSAYHNGETGGVASETLDKIADTLVSFGWLSHPPTQKFINKHFAIIAKALPNAIKNPESFDCGWCIGYKKAIIDLQEFLDNQREIK